MSVPSANSRSTTMSRTPTPATILDPVIVLDPVRPPLRVCVVKAPVQDPVVKSDTIVVVYARVSTPQQADQLPGQVSDVRTVANRVYGHVAETLSVVGSGREWTTLTKKLSSIPRLRRIGKKIKVVLAVKDVSRLTRQKTEHVDNLRQILHDYKITHVYLANADLEIKIEDLHRNPVFMKGMNAADVEGMAIRDRMRDAERLKPLCFERRFDCVDVCIDQLRDLAHAIAVCLEENPESDPDYTVQDLIELFRRSGVTLDLEFSTPVHRLDDVYGVDANLPMTELARILNRHRFSVDDELVVKKWTCTTLKKWARHYNRYVEKTKYVPEPIRIDVEQMTDAFSKFGVETQTAKTVHVEAQQVQPAAQWISFYYNGHPNSLPPTWNGPTPPIPGFYYINNNQ